MVESIVAKINVVVTSSALVLASFASVAWVVLRTCVCYSHYNTSAVTSAVTTAVVLASDFEFSSAHGGWAGRTLTLANVSIATVVAVAF